MHSGKISPVNSLAGRAAPLTADALRALMLAAWPDATVQVRDDSAKHAGHAGQKEHGGGHYDMTVVWAGFDGLGRLARQRAVHAVLAEAFAGRLIHALSLTLTTPEEI